MKQVLSVLALAAATALATPAFAQTYRAVASGPAESPPNGSPGSSLVTIDIGASNLMVDMPFRDLVGTASAAHIHCCTVDAFTGTASGAASGLVDGINANVASVNIHSSAHPGGEIRGFIVAAPVPEPAEWALLAGGLGGLLWAGRRRRPEMSWQK
jgi:hypothetical protein